MAWLLGATAKPGWPGFELCLLVAELIVVNSVSLGYVVKNVENATRDVPEEGTMRVFCSTNAQEHGWFPLREVG